VSDYVQSTNFATKDALSSGDPLKIVKGTEINTEFANIAVAVATKADLASPTFTGTPTLPTGTIAVTQSSSDDSTKLATTAFVQDVADAIKAALFPVGSIYTNSSVATNPGTLLGFGTWSAFGAGRVMVGFNSGNALFDTAEETGGSADSTLPSHTHTFSGTTSTIGTHQHEESIGTVGTFGTGGTYSRGNYGGTGSGTVDLTNAGGSHDHTYSGTTASAGTSGTNANYQPYITVYMWKRTA
jgi:hypothetical protein